MDDMDQEAKLLGGKVEYFSGKYKDYRWSNVIDLKLSGEERFNLYARAINDLPKNEKLPILFRDVFKNAFLPYRDPETLNLFLKEIDGFSYDNSENLGNAFEYLLSILGSQGDAGQFRTPRHIIDFIVEVLSPTKDDSILDPACGTAGFLISAYKHIERDNSEEYDPDKTEVSFRKGGLDAFSVPLQISKEYRGSKLKPNERKKLQKKMMGYDISPDMVKLSLVNMYLHRFKEPQIYEYDTLTSDNRWGDDFDLILANPPFMSPKGGIRPHNRFSVKSNRSEVLFVDYIAEHLSLNGRAGIIVPEGIIFKGDKAYKQLRKMLVEDNFLWAVASLPAGIFNPYSGVKTSILFLDRQKAKSTKEILFLNIESDGFDLGATRRRTEENDLPKACEILKADRSGKKNKKQQNDFAHWVQKKKIIDSGDWNLSGSRYKEIKERPTKWPMVELGEVAKLVNGRAYKREELLKKGKTPVLRVGNFFSNRNWYYSNLNLPPEKYCHKGDLLYAWSASFGPQIWDGPKAIFHYHIWKIEISKSIDKSFLYLLLEKESEKIKSEGSGMTMIHMTKRGMEKRKFPLPPLDIQKEIVAEIDGYQKIIDGAKQVVDNWKPMIKVDPKWPMVELEEIAKIESGFGFPKNYQGKPDQEIPFLKVSDMNTEGNENEIIYWNNTVSTKELKKLKAKSFPINTIIFPKIGAAIKTNKKRILTKKSTFDNNVMGAIPNENKIAPRFLYIIFVTTIDLTELATKSNPPSIRKAEVKKYKIPLPSVDVQKKILTRIEEEKKLIESNKNLVRCFEEKVRNTIDDIWNTIR